MLRKTFINNNLQDNLLTKTTQNNNHKLIINDKSDNSVHLAVKDHA